MKDNELPQNNDYITQYDEWRTNALRKDVIKLWIEGCRPIETENIPHEVITPKQIENGTQD